MDHAEIERLDIVDRYLLGELSSSEAIRFERHYLSCPACLDQLEAAEALARGMKQVAIENRRFRTLGMALLLWLQSRRPKVAAGLAAATFALLLAAPTGIAWQAIRDRDHQLAAARLLATRATAQVADLRTQLDRSQAERERLDAQLAEARRPQSDVSLLFLYAERGAGEGEPTNRLRLQARPVSCVFTLAVEPPHRAAYRVVLEDGRRRPVWTGEDLHLNELESVSFALPSALFAPGDYTFEVQGIGPGARAVPAGRFPFRVVPQAARTTEPTR